MREIKFRAWDGNKLLHQEALFWNGESFVSGLWQNCQTHIEWGDQVEVELMQYTGLKDRNGVEVFEGDVVSYTNMKLGQQVAVVEWNPFGSMAGFQCKNPFVNIFDSEEILVVGNIHENPELLEQIK